MAIGTTEALSIFYSQFLPRGLELPLFILLLYGVYLLISAGILLTALKTAGGKVSYLMDLPRAVFTIILRDLITVPLIILALAIPIFGIIIAFVIWLAILKFIFQLSWLQAFLTWLVGGILQIILIVLVIIPLFLML